MLQNYELILSNTESSGNTIFCLSTGADGKSDHSIHICREALNPEKSEWTGRATKKQAHWKMLNVVLRKELTEETVH